MRTKGQLEAEISEAIIKFEKEYLGRGPEETKTFIVEDVVLVRLRTVVRDITGHDVRSLHTDISTVTGERVIIFTLDDKPQLREQP